MGRRGGIALVFKASMNLRIVSSSHGNDFSSFEYMDRNVVDNYYSLRIAVVYRQHHGQENALKSHIFLEHEWPQFLSKICNNR